MKSLEKMASKDAFRWARAEMFFGAGAGTRRKLVEAEVSQKMQDIPGYADLFMTWYEKQDMADHAIRAAKERKRIDRAAGLNRNAKAVVSGNHRNMSPVLFVAFVGGVALHKTGYDKVLWEKGQQEYRKARLWWHGKLDESN